MLCQQNTNIFCINMDFLCDGTSIRIGNHHEKIASCHQGDRDLVRAPLEALPVAVEDPNRILMSGK